MNIEIRDKAREIAEDLRNGCDGSYVGAERTESVEMNGNDIELFVCAFWEKSFWFEYSAKGCGVDEQQTVFA